MPLIDIEVEGLQKAANKLRKLGETLDRDGGSVGRAMILQVERALVALYGDELGSIDKGMWEIAFTQPSGTLGLLSVRSDHPFVLGYEFGVGLHEIHARNVDNLRFFWELRGVEFLGPAVYRAHATAHHHLPYLIKYLQELGRFGWSSAINAAIRGDSYTGVVDGGPYVPVLFSRQYNEDRGGN